MRRSSPEIRTPESGRPALLATWEVVWVGLCSVALFISWYAFAARCSETCADGANQPQSPPLHRLSWRHYNSGWQWTAQLALAGLALTLAVAALRLKALKPRLVVGAISLTAGTAWVLLMFVFD